MLRKMIMLLVFGSCFLFVFGIAVGAGETGKLSKVSLDDMVVTPTLMVENWFDIPTPVEVVSAETLGKLSSATAAQPLAMLPGVSLSRAGFWNVKPMIRGLGGSRVLVLIDGDRENNLWGGRSPLTPFVDVSNVERIEVVKGPASVLYGTDAMGGLINIITKDPGFAKQDEWTYLNSIESRYSSVDNGWFGRYALGGGGYGLDFQLAVAARSADEYKDGAGETVDNSQFDGQSVDFKSRYFVSDDHELNMSIRVNQINDMGVTKKQDARYSRFDKFDTDTYKIAYHGSNIGWLEELKIRSWYVDQARSYEGYIPSAKSPVYALKGNKIDTSALGTSMQGQVNFGQNNRLVFGYEYVVEDADGDEHIEIRKNTNDAKIKDLSFNPVPSCSREHFGVFAQDEMLFGERVILLAGLRYDCFVADADDAMFAMDVYDPKAKKAKKAINRFSRKTDDAVTFNLGLLYVLNKNIHLTSNLSSGFRAPDLFERFSTRSSSYMIIGNPDLDSEYSYNADVGFKLNYQRLRSSWSCFYNMIDNYIELANIGDKFAGMEAHNYINVVEAELYGFDGSLDFDVLDEFTVFGNLAYVAGYDRNSRDRLNSIPPLNGILGARWHDQLANGVKYWFELSGVFYDRQDHPAKGEKETAGYSIFNLCSGVEFDYGYFKDVTLTLNVENLFDTEYRDHLSVDDFYNEPGLNVVVALKTSF